MKHKPITSRKAKKIEESEELSDVRKQVLLRRYELFGMRRGDSEDPFRQIRLGLHSRIMTKGFNRW